MKALINYRLILSACCLLLASCSSGSGIDSPGPTGAESPAQASTIALSGLSLLDGSLLDESASQRISVRWSHQAGAPLATIIADEVHELKALYFELEHDPDLASASLQGGPWAGGDSLQLALTPAAGRTQAGIVLLDPDNAAGFSGSGVLAELTFCAASGSVAKTSSKAPLSELNRIDFSYAPDLTLCYWFYQNQGDYDQNGEVNISDLTPLAIHFGKAAAGGSFAFSSVESVVDGDGNGLINISDITPIGVNFGNRVTDFNIYGGPLSNYPQSPAEPSSAAQLASKPFTEHSGVAGQDRLFFTTPTQVPLPPTSGIWLRPADGPEEGIPSDISGFGNQSPVAHISVSSSAGLAPLNLTADGSASTDPDGDPLTFSWLYGDQLSLFGSTEVFDPADQGPSLQLELDNPGTYGIFLIVRDPDGALNFAQTSVVAADTAGWQIIDLDLNVSDIDEPLDVDVMEIDGHPAMAYAYHTTASGARIYMAETDGILDESWDSTDNVWSQSNVNDCEVAVMEVDGTMAAVATLRRSSGGEAVFARQITAGEADLYNTLHLENPPGELAGVDACVVNGQAMLTWRNVATDEIRFAWAIDGTAQNFAGPVSLAITGAPDSQINMLNINGAPAICYWAGPSSNRLRYHKSVMNGVVPIFDSGTTLSVLTGGIVQDGLIELADGSPCMLFGQSPQLELYSLHAKDATASMWENGGQVTDGNASMVEYAAGLHNGRPAVLWYDLLTATLHYQRALDETGSSWGAAELIDDSLAIGVRPCLTEVRGVPVIAYLDRGRGEFRYGVYVE